MATKPERPWQDVLLEKHAERERKKGRVTSGVLPRMQFNAMPAFTRAVDAAARTRNYDRSTYIRRVLALHVARDLGFPLKVLLAACPVPKIPRVTGYAMENSNGHDEGEGIDKLCPHPGCDGQHLRDALR